MISLAKLSGPEKTRLVILLIALLIGVYFLLIYAKSAEQIKFTENMISRRQNRIEAHTVEIKLPPVSAKGLEKELEKVEAELAEARAKLTGLQSRFATPGDAGQRQAVLLSISQLAADTGVEIQRLAVIEGPAGATAAPNTLEPSVFYGHPIAVMEASGNFHALLALLDGLGQLSRSVTVIKLSLVVPDEHPSRGELTEPISATTTLQAELHLAL